MNKAVLTSADLIVSPFQFESITELSVVREMNEHVRFSISGIVAEDKLDRYVEQEEENSEIEVKIRNGEQREINLFHGVVTKLTIDAHRNVRRMTIEAQSSTMLMDISKESRSYQNTSRSYHQLIQNIAEQYAGADVVDNGTNRGSIGSLVVQYKETDWQFIKRLASHFHAPLVPVASQSGVKIFVGIPDLGEPYKLDEFNYSIIKNLKEYMQKTAGEGQQLHEDQIISYEVTSGTLLELCQPVTFHKRKLYVYRATTAIENGLVMNRYELRDKQGMGCRTIYPYELAGASLFGKVSAISKDKVQLKLDIDHGESDGSIWFPYSTVYSSPDGSGWYCMPEVGDEIRLYFPNEHEKDAFAASSVDAESADTTKRSDPSVKSIGTKHGKQIVFQPGAIEIIGNGQLMMRLTDDGGIEIKSDKKITLDAKEDIDISGGTNVVIQGVEGVNLIQQGANLTIADQVNLMGTRVNLS
ncbi:contractile injection system protein, VgrG/Pvc8 family [Paenibacillus sp. MMS18-CY102]|uniref:contractile injection system protein, VgrG/Pvc8 family n=1 Tax=Paenibacillus sp. MMS18-CY102 TaxID=2682849 RepID=UPI001365351A|nr:contractile injection system protein, VgrG/Pvc8 family [Paenibacillus sp. MMS18-CY102]MWC31269.1 phage tail protein [Paenibacillus sp. MMS18-CY102]